jgi:hypothetical protein
MRSCRGLHRGSGHPFGYPHTNRIMRRRSPHGIARNPGTATRRRNHHFTPGFRQGFTVPSAPERIARSCAASSSARSKSNRRRARKGTLGGGVAISVGKPPYQVRPAALSPACAASAIGSFNAPIGGE